MPINSADNPRAYQPVRRPVPAPQDVAILIPVYQPAAVLEGLVANLLNHDVPAILLVDDGSSPAYREIFDRLAQEPRVHLLRHETNSGKGSALKTGIRYFLRHYAHYAGLVTADADAQHHPEDILRLARTLQRSPHLVILGARKLGDDRRIPLRSRFGNRLILALFRGVARVALTDAQTGLRAFPSSILPALARLPGRRYDYEMTVLLFVARSRMSLAEQPIRTLYDPGNPTSHFRPVVDSFRVLAALFHLQPMNAPLYDAVLTAPSKPGVPEPHKTARLR